MLFTCFSVFLTPRENYNQSIWKTLQKLFLVKFVLSLAFQILSSISSILVFKYFLISTVCATIAVVFTTRKYLVFMLDRSVLGYWGYIYSLCIFLGNLLCGFFWIYAYHLIGSLSIQVFSSIFA